MSPRRFSFEFDARYRLAGRPFGVTPESAHVELDEDRFIARFGPWSVETPLSNVRGAGVSGPYALAKTIGPAHLSFADRGLTFATNGRAGACLTFRSPVRGIDPLGLIRHPGLTVTVADPESFVAELTSGAVLRTDLDRKEAEQHAIDRLHTMTASELRSVADEMGVRHTSSMDKSHLVRLIESKTGDQLAEVLEDQSA